MEDDLRGMCVDYCGNLGEDDGRLDRGGTGYKEKRVNLDNREEVKNQPHVFLEYERISRITYAFWTVQLRGM